jgi:POT family proton-dependent oligopeptide transporter
MHPPTDPGAAKVPARQRTLLGHPLGLYVLFLTQTWERFSYYGMLALLILYLNNHLRMQQDSASAAFKWYTSAIYFTPLMGGYLAGRFLGNTRAVIIGAVLMAVGHFLMAFPTLPALYTALILLVVGCGLLTPPLTAQVGLLYAPHDPRRDSAYTIFYMGINLGAFAAPLACGWLAENTRGRYHSGFTLAGIGMVIALLTYLIGHRWVVEIDQTTSAPTDANTGTTDPGVLSEAAVEQTPSVAPRVNRFAPGVLAVVGAVYAIGGLVLGLTGVAGLDAVVFLEVTAACALAFGWVASAVRGGLRDRVLVVLVLGGFSVFYWAGAGQYGNAINLWADQNTGRYLGRPAPPPELFPEAAAAEAADRDDSGAPGGWERWTNLFRLRAKPTTDKEPGWGEWWSGLWNPVPTAWFQSINPLLILLLAPFFAMLWPRLARRGLNPSIPVKMALGLLLMVLAFGLMFVAAGREGRQSSVRLPAGTALPGPLVVNDQGQLCRAEDGRPYDGGRLFYDGLHQRLLAVGVLPVLARDEIVGDTAPPDFAKKVEELKEKAAEAAAGPAGWSVQVQLNREPPDFDLRYAGLGGKVGNREIGYDPATRTLTATVVLGEKEVKGLRVAAGDPALRTALNELLVAADSARVAPWWLVGFFLLATLGELCLAPVGLSMVSQLAPARFATLLMGLWLLVFAFGNFLAGTLGERWGTWAPGTYFLVVLAVVGVPAVALLVLRRRIAALMHGGGE